MAKGKMNAPASALDPEPRPRKNTTPMIIGKGWPESQRESARYAAGVPSA